MRKRKGASHLPYGAYELKAKYQRNMLMGMMLTVLLICAIGAVFLIPSQSAKADPQDTPPIPPEMDTIWVRKEIPPPISISHDDDPFAESGGPKPDPPEIPSAIVMVDDSVDIDNDVQILSRDELADAVSSRGPDIEGGTYGNGFAIEAPGEGSIFPEPDSFVVVDEQPQMVFMSQPEYPSLARKAGLEGDVWVKALVDRDGKVQKVIVSRSSDIVSLDEAAVESARKCRYRPAIRGGQPVAIWVTYKIEFSLDK